METEYSNQFLPLTIVGDDITLIRAAGNRSGTIGIEVKISMVDGVDIMVQLLENFGDEWVLRMVKEL